MWLELHLHTSSEQAHALSDELTSLGAEAVTFQDGGDQPIYEPPPGALELWHETVVIGLFEHSIEISTLINQAEQWQATGIIHRFQLNHLADQDWERVCLMHFKPLQFGQRLWICPSWETPPEPQAVNITLDPGLAFGTGSHPTTALCLEWLDQHVEQPNCVIDYGCGSGILALAALKLGAKQVFAIDNDPQALEATQKNAERNGLTAPQITVSLPKNFNKSTPVDILIANILAQPLIELAPLFAQLVRPGGRLLLSGILAEQVDYIIKNYEKWFDLPAISQRAEWVRVSGIRR